MARALKRLDEVRQLAIGLPRTDRLPKTRVLALARFAGAAKAQAVVRLPDERRVATLRHSSERWKRARRDDVLDLFDLLINGRYARTDARGIPCRAATAWKEGEVRPTAQPAVKAVRWWRSRRDPFETTWPLLRQWFEAEPERTGRELFERLQPSIPASTPSGVTQTE